jgi:hypothetical protein
MPNLARSNIILATDAALAMDEREAGMRGNGHENMEVLELWP